VKHTSPCQSANAPTCFVMLKVGSTYQPRVSAYSTSCIQAPDKAVILSEALVDLSQTETCMARSRRAYPERSRGNPGDARLQMLLGAFRPQTTTQDKKVTTPAGAEWRDLLFFPPSSIPSSVTFSLRHSTRNFNFANLLRIEFVCARRTSASEANRNPRITHPWVGVGAGDSRVSEQISPAHKPSGLVILR
jgi:hypothetical protein